MMQIESGGAPLKKESMRVNDRLDGRCMPCKNRME